MKAERAKIKREMKMLVVILVVAVLEDAPMTYMNSNVLGKVTEAGATPVGTTEADAGGNNWKLIVSLVVNGTLFLILMFLFCLFLLSVFVFCCVPTV